MKLAAGEQRLLAVTSSPSLADNREHCAAGLAVLNRELPRLLKVGQHAIPTSRKLSRVPLFLECAVFLMQGWLFWAAGCIR